MNAAITFSENRLRTKRAGSLKRIPSSKLIKTFQQFIEKSNWGVNLLKYEKHLNLFSWVGVAASVFFFIPVCVSIFTR